MVPDTVREPLRRFRGSIPLPSANRAMMVRKTVQKETMMPYTERIKKIARAAYHGLIEKECGPEWFIECMTDRYWDDMVLWKENGVDPPPDRHEARVAIGCMLRDGRLVADEEGMLWAPAYYPNTVADIRKRKRRPRRKFEW